MHDGPFVLGNNSLVMPVTTSSLFHWNTCLNSYMYERSRSQPCQTTIPQLSNRPTCTLHSCCTWHVTLLKHSLQLHKFVATSLSTACCVCILQISPFGRSFEFLTQSMWLMRRSDKWHNACQSLIWCEPVDYVSLATLHEHSPLKTIDVLFGLRCRSHLCPGSDPREGQAWLGYEWSRTMSNQWTLVFTLPGGKQMTVRNGVASWAQQCSSRSRLWREKREISPFALLSLQVICWNPIVLPVYIPCSREIQIYKLLTQSALKQFHLPTGTL